MTGAGAKTGEKTDDSTPLSAHDPGFALYVHWPFCLAKCPYCDFNSHVRPTIDHGRYRKALQRELDKASEGLTFKPLRSIFFGGGTPSLMEPETAAAIIEQSRAMFSFEPGIEITLEANPTSVEASKLEGFAGAGVNRLSLGVQSFDDDALRFLGREHSAGEAKDAISTMRQIFERWSFDLIYARPDQAVSSWQHELEQALAFDPGHLSLYQLTIEPGTAFARLHQGGRFQMPDDEHQASLYDGTLNTLRAHGFQRYEISNYARPGQECRHNLVYWNYGDYLGIGPGAHGRIKRSGHRYATLNQRVPERWLNDIDAGGEQSLERIEPDDQIVEYLIMGLRLQSGINLSRIRRVEASLGRHLLDDERITALCDQGWLNIEQDRLRASDRGLLNLDFILREIIR